jgi:hypothetical protein
MRFVIPIAMVIFLAFLSPLYVSAQKGWKSYTIEDEYSFQYPSNWKLQERENRFTSVDAKLTSGNNDVQMAFGGAPIGVATDEEILQQMESIIEKKDNGNVFESGIDKQMSNNRTAPYVIGTYSARSLLGTPLKAVELLTSIKLPNNELVIVEYHAKENDFDKYLPKVKQMINSISPVNSTSNVLQ